MEAEHSRPSDGERYGGRQQALSESSHKGRSPQIPEQSTSLTIHGSHGRHQKRQPKRRDLLQRQQQQQSQMGEALQLQLVPGPSGGSYPSSSLESSAPVPPLQSIPSNSSQELQEGTTSRRERKPQKPGKYVCSYCGRPCAKPSVLQKHIRSHTGERPYPCVPCSFSFKTKSNLYKHRKSHAHRIKAGLASKHDEYSFSGVESGAVGDDQEEATEADSTESEDETGQHQPSTSHDRPALRKSSKVEISFSEEGPRTEDSQAVKQRLAMRLSERKRVPMESPDESPSSSLGPGSKGSTESGYFSSYGSAELTQVSPPNASVKSYAEIILGKYGRLGQQQRIPHQHLQSSSSSSGHEEKPIPFTVPKTQVIEHITKLITINEAVVDTSEIDSVKPRRSSLSRRSSIESAKFSSPNESKEDFPGTSSATGQFILSGYATDVHSQIIEGTLSSHFPSSVLLRSQSVPSSSGKDDPTISSSHGFRLSQSFDEQQAASAELRTGHHHRMLRRQPAIEMPVGAEVTAEAGSSVPKESGWKHQKGIHYECEICGTRFDIQDSYEEHRISCMNKPSQEHQSEKKASAEKDHRQIMHYKFKAMAMAIRKRRKEESLEEDPPSPGPTAISFSSHLTTSAIGNKDDYQAFSGTIPQIEPEKTGPYKEISVIQHTSSFERQESMSIESQESEPEHKQSQEPKQTSTSRLVRQPKIQVPEILVTKEPDPEMVSPPASTYIPRELEKEEFQWPQRSQTLAQLPAEKLPPKKKRLRLAEAPQSSGESSFESVSLPRSPSQESNVSHTSSRSTSLDEAGKIDPEMQTGSWSSQGSHMLTVPGAYQHYHREMHRSASEQAPASPPYPAQIVEARSKSFDYGSLSQRPASSSWKERRKCLLVKHATLEKPDQEESSSSIHQSYPVYASEHRASSTAKHSQETLGKTLQVFQTPIPLPSTAHPLSSPETFSTQQITEFLPVTTISEVLSTRMLQQALIQTVPSSFRPRQLHLSENLGLPVQPYPALLSLHYPTSGLVVQDPLASPIVESGSSLSSTHRRGPPYHQLVSRHQPRPIIATCLEQFRPVVSLVVPVRLQTHIPTYASAMYTTISQILATTQAQQPICCTAMVIMEKLKGTKLQRSYLSLPTPNLKTYIPLSLPLEFRAETTPDDGCGPLCAGGNKRMLSPAGSLELSLEAQRQQKRIKEEAEESVEEIKSCETFLEESQGADKEELRNRKCIEVVVEKEQELEGKKTEFVINKPGISQVESGLKKEEKQEEGHRCASVVDSPERSTHSTDPLYPSLHTSTSVSWCYLNYTKPTPSAHTNPQASVYSSWSVSMYNPNLPGLSTKIVLSLLCSKQVYSGGVYTMATTPPLKTDKLLGNHTPRVSEVHANTLNSPVEEKEEPLSKKVEKDTSTEENPTTSKHNESLRVCIFEGGYKSNEEYVYVRGRGRGKYVCGECGIRCKKPSMLKKHIRTHTDIRPYVCKHCNFAFKTKGNLTKHMKSKAHGKKCLEKGVSESSVDELETEEPETSEGHVYESEDQEEHQFSDIEDSEVDDDEDNEEEEEDLSSHEDVPSSCSTDTHQSDSGPGSQTWPSCLPVSEREETEKQLSPVKPWRSGQAVSSERKRALFSSKAWEHSPRAFSPSSEGSPLQSVSPRLEVSSPCRHLSPSPERVPSPLTTSPLRSFSPLLSLSPAHYRSSRARLSPTPFRTQHRAHSSPGHFHWEPNTKSRESQQERSSTPSTAHATQRLSPPHASLMSSALQFPHSDPPIHVPSQSRTVDHTFSHLPLHSQQQARMPYHMIPIGGIQMVQLRHRSCPKLERASSSTQSPSSPKEEFTFSLSKNSWNLQTETTWSSSGMHSLELETRRLGLHCPATSSTTAKSSLPSDFGKQNYKDSKQYGSSWPSKTCTIVPETSQEEGHYNVEGHNRSSDVSEKDSRASLHKKCEQSEVSKQGQSKKHDPTSEEKSVHSDMSQDSNPDST